jgi:hypothetical protein
MRDAPTLTLVFTLLFTLGALLYHASKSKLTPQLKAVLVAASLVSIFYYTSFGTLMSTRDPVVPTKQRNAFLHWHEVFHYYIGAKYYKELGNDGLYVAYLLADTESAAPQYTGTHLRDLSNQVYPITAGEAIKRATEKYRPRFTEVRWHEFKRDTEALKKIAFPGWLNLGLFDAGFNPPPSWNVIGYPLANAIPISKNGGTLNDHWEYIELIPFLDVMLLAIASAFVYRSFGFIGLVAFLITFGTGYLSSMRWTGGSFLRHLWFFWLVLGTCMMKEKKYLGTGICLGLSSLMALFPFVFVVGAGLWLILQSVKKSKITPELQDFAIGVVGISVLFIGISLLMFGLPVWVTFFERIQTHSNMFFVWHIGYKKIATWAPWVPGQNFWWQDGLNNFRGWNARLNERWNDLLWFNLPLIGMILGSCVWAMRKMRGEEAMILFGALVIFFFSIPANYYYIYYTLLPVVIFQPGAKDWRPNAIIAAFLGLWFLLHTVSRFGGDDLTQAYRQCWLICIFLLVWVGLHTFHKNSAIVKYISRAYRS